MAYAKVRFQRSTKGENAEVLVGKAIAYTTQTTLANFQANAAEGEIGVYNADTGARISTAMAAGTRYITALKRDGQAFLSTPIIHDLARTRRTAYIAPVKQVTTIVISAAQVTAINNGITAVPVQNQALQYASITLIETTPGNEPYPTLDYDYEVGNPAGITASVILNAIVARINNPLDLVHKDDGLQYSASISGNDGSGYTITITSYYFGQHFRVALRGILSNGTITYTTPFKQGVGDSDSVNRIEDEGLIYAGVTTNYPGMALPSEFGRPTKFTVDGLTYNTYQIDPLRVSKEPMPQSVHHHWAHIYFIVPVPVGGDAPTRAASSPDYTLGTVLGFTLTA